MMHHALSQADGFADALLTEQVCEELAAVLDLELAEVQPTAQLRRDFGCQPRDFDSIRWMLEQRWGFTVPIHAVAGWRDVGDLVAYVGMRLQQGASA